MGVNQEQEWEAAVLSGKKGMLSSAILPLHLYECSVG